MRNRRAVFALTALAVLLFFLSIAATLVFGSVFDLNFGREGTAGSTEVSIATLLWGALACFSLWVVIVYVFIRDRLSTDEPISRLYAPLLCLTLSLALYTALTALQALDLLTHGLKAHYAPLYEPEVRLIENALLIGVFASLAALMYAIMRGRRWEKTKLAGLFCLVFGGAALLVIIGVILANN